MDAVQQQRPSTFSSDRYVGAANRRNLHACAVHSDMVQGRRTCYVLFIKSEGPYIILIHVLCSLGWRLLASRHVYEYEAVEIAMQSAVLAIVSLFVRLSCAGIVSKRPKLGHAFVF